MVTVDLFQNSKCDNMGRMGNFASLSEQTQYFNGLSGLHITGTLTEDVGTIEVQYPWTTIIGYSYGRYQSNGIYIYFSIRDIEVVNPTKCRILYDVDCWETCRFQKSITLGRGVIHRSARNLSSKMVRPIDPVYTRTTVLSSPTPTTSIPGLTGFAFVHDSTEDVNYIYMASVAGSTQGIGPFIDGSWLTNAGVSNVNDVVGAWLSPWGLSTSGWETTGPTAIQAWRVNARDFDDIVSFISMNVTTAPYGDSDTVIGVTDMRGNVIWSSDYSDDFGTYWTMELNISPSSCSWTVRIGSSNEGRFTIPCEPTYYFSDTFTEYVARQRQYDQEMRSLNNDKQLVGSITGIASNAIGGAVAGSLAGPVGAAGGAILGAVGSVLGSVANYAMAPSFDSREQRITDEYYRKQADSLAFTGDSLVSILNGYTKVSIVQIENDTTTQDVLSEAISSAGYYYSSLEVSDMEDWIVDGPLMADVEVLGGIPTGWKQQIMSRFANGVILS